MVFDKEAKVIQYRRHSLFQKITLYKKLHVTFDENDVWKIFIQITKGLHDLHEFNILHRDLKSANVFLFRDGTAKLGDLNVSKISFRGLGCTQTGTPYYASPEVWKDNPYDLKSDIWSLGCLCYELLMLKTPFRADSMENLYRKVMKGEYPEINKRYSNKFDDIISYMLQLKPENRPNTDSGCLSKLGPWIIFFSFYFPKGICNKCVIIIILKG